jgi:hypothetical protein
MNCKEQWLNTCDYTPLQLGLVLAGTIFWVIAYFFIIKDGVKYKFVEMPYLAGAANFANEFAWTFLLVTDLGLLFVWGLRIWFFMDIFIFYLLLKYGDKQIRNETIRKFFKPLVIIVFLWWIPVFYFMYHEGYDTSIGAFGAYIITVMMASLYINLRIINPPGAVFSPYTGWLRLFGNTCMSIFVFSKYPDIYYLKMLCIAVFILNLSYVILQKNVDKILKN